MRDKTLNDELFKNELLSALQGLASGDCSTRLSGKFSGLNGKIAAQFNVLVEELSQSLGVVLHTLQAEVRTRGLLSQSQALGRELQEQQQQLLRANEELEKKASLLALQKGEVEAKNREIEQARQALQEKAAQLGLTSKYKTEFLANMSHELRTPLNSMLLLARQLMENQEQTMTVRQMEFAKVIHGAGNELLRLINDILDLSKIESGIVTVDVGEMQFWELQEFVERNFRLVAKSKELGFTIDLSPSLPASMETDGKRLEQVLKNLLANAFKFTSKGKVCLRIFPAISGWNPENGALNHAPHVVGFEVSDTGIGIPIDKHKLIFESFQQGDGSTNRRFGGTGLGLSISREIAQLLGGEIQLRSTVGEGSVFTLFLPCRFLRAKSAESNEGMNQPVEVFLRDEKCAGDDRARLQSGDRVFLCIEDELDFAGCLLDLAREHGFKGLSASHGEQAFELIRQYKPDAITLDLTLPDMDGWKILSRLKDEPSTRHLPVAIISADEERVRGMKNGAVKFLLKPASRSALKNAFAEMKALPSIQHKSILYVTAEEAERDRLVKWIGPLVQMTAARGGQAALAALKNHSFDCVVMDLDLPDMTGVHLLNEIKQRRLRDMPVVVFAKRKLSSKEHHQIHKLEEHLIINLVYSPERLLDQAALFLHLPVDRLSEPAQQLLHNLHGSDAPLAGKLALIVDDDLRNIFAITSLLERHGMRIISSETGRGAIDILENGALVDIVLMDIMMPGLDGYATMRLLRKNQKFDSLPIIAVTAKAMREDRTRCLQAGASDYVPKPVDSQQLLTTLRLWLHR